MHKDLRIARTAFLAFIALAACRAEERAKRSESAPPLSRAPEALEIAQLEARRTDGSGRLQAHLAHADPTVRWRAATALGRMPYPEFGDGVTSALLASLEDPDEGVRAAVVFALGMRRDPNAAEALITFSRTELRGSLRARAVEAVSKLDRPDLHETILDSLDDSAQEVRREALIAPHRWPTDLANATQTERRIIEHALREDDVERMVDALFTLQRRRCEAARSLFLQHASSPIAEARIFAVRGLARISSNPTVREVLQQATRDEDWRVACEAALGLGSYPLDEVAGTLLSVARREPPHLRRCVFESALRALGGAELSLDSSVQSLAQEAARLAERDRSPAVRRAAAAAHMRFEFARNGQLPSELLERSATGDAADPLLAAELARGMAGLPSAHAVPWLVSLCDDKLALVREAALEALAAHDVPAAHGRLLTALRDPDNGVRLAAVSALADQIRPEDLAAIAALFDSTRGDVSVEVRAGALLAVAPLATRDAEALLLRGLSAPEPFVRQTAALKIAEFFPETDLRQVEVAPPPSRQAAVPIPGVDLALDGRNPRVRIETTRGPMVFELFPSEAPVHVHNFLTRAARGYYDGLTFHRVVPDFVIQGGDYRGDGNGGSTWRGATDTLGHEIGPRKYVRGSLGMPRYDDWDSGGSQIFVTHRRAPHLDGRYTIFGELRLGEEHLDEIELGDRMLNVQVLAGP